MPTARAGGGEGSRRSIVLGKTAFGLRACELESGLLVKVGIDLGGYFRPLHAVARVRGTTAVPREVEPVIIF